MERWRINRAGVVNFWYYDDEEFEFEDGRLLLRGANGSGKSVTMQSLVPLLFDGNKSPERLDPFGSRARKMESYLLSDGLDVEERTGYLFVEFAKQKSDRYMTIGMGMRARRNMQMQTWYFVIKDNSRIGKNHDISLYKEIGEKIPLTQKEFENRIGKDNVYDRQGDYKREVNNNLFGFDDLSNFDELIELLIQIRSPKLSKEFKPTTMYEIMQNSLVTLSDDDLRPMSEAIESMDEIKIKIEALERSKDALKRIDFAYSRYNQAMLVLKADKYSNYLRLSKTLSGKLKDLDKIFDKNLKDLALIEENIVTRKEEERQLGMKMQSLMENDLSKLAAEKVDTKARADRLSEEIEKKREQLEDFKIREIDARNRLKKTSEEKEKTVDKIGNLLDEMMDFANSANFDEHAFMKGEYLNEEGEYSFSYHTGELNKYRRNLKESAKLLEEQERISEKNDNIMKDLDEIVKSKNKKENQVGDHERQLEEIREEYVERVFSWNKNNLVLGIDTDSLRLVSDRVYQYGDRYRFDQILDPVRFEYEKFRNEINSSISELDGKMALKKDEMLEKQKELNEIIKKQDPEPERNLSVVRNRERLVELGIAHIPLYRAFDFIKDVSDEIKGYLEGALSDMGILDALIVNPADREIVMEMDRDMADKYIFARPELLSHNLSFYLKPENDAGKIPTSLIDDVLKSIFLNESNNIHISEQGEYGFGILKGKASNDYELRYIGYQSRKRYKEILIKRMSDEINIVKTALDLLNEESTRCKDQLNKGRAEWEKFPVDDDLKFAYESLKDQKSDLDRIKREEVSIRDEAEKLFKELKEIQTRVHEKTKDIYIVKTRSAFDEAIEDMEDYSRLYSEFMSEDSRKRYILESLLHHEEQLKNCLKDIDDIIYELNQRELELKGCQGRLYNIEEELKLSNYDEIVSEMESCKARLDKIPDEFQEMFSKKSNIEASNKMIVDDREKKGNEINENEKLLNLYEKALAYELSLGYIRDFEEEGSLEKAARGAIQLYGNLLEEGRTIFDYRELLIEKQLKEMGELAEYNLKRIDLFKDKIPAGMEDEKSNIERMDIMARMSGKKVKFYEMMSLIEESIKNEGSVLSEKDRYLFEDILINSVSRQITAKIYQSEKWVKVIDQLMNDMNTSSGLSFNLKWNTKRAESEDQMSTRELVGLLKGSDELLSVEQRESLIKHFRSKIQESKNRADDASEHKSFLSVMKEILDYRKWFEFQLYYTKKGEKKKELTNNAFYTFSGGEKAMAMYVPLFSAVYAKYQGGSSDCPKVVSLDEAFAGVDEKNIEDMFKLLVELDLSFIANSQVLFGDYETVPALGIYELIRPENATFVTLIRYLWNGRVRQLVPEEMDE